MAVLEYSSSKQPLSKNRKILVVAAAMLIYPGGYTSLRFTGRAVHTQTIAGDGVDAGSVDCPDAVLAVFRPLMSIEADIWQIAHHHARYPSPGDY